MGKKLINTRVTPERVTEAFRMQGSVKEGIRIDAKNIVFGRGSSIGSNGEFRLPRKTVIDIMNNALARKGTSKE